MTEAGREAPGRPRRRGGYANGRRTRAALVDAAFRVFAEQGYQGLSIRQIAEAIGTSHTALLHHFGSKDALLSAVLDRREELEGPGRGELLREHGILATVPEIMRANANEPGVIQLDMTLRTEALNPEHPAHDYVTRRQGLFVTSVRDELEAERARGRLRDDLDLDIAARLITSQIEGIQLAWLTDRTIDMAAHLETLLGLFRKPSDGAPPEG